MKKFIFEDEQEDLDILAEDDLDLVEDDEEVEQVNEVRYIDPDNLDKYDKDEIEEVTTASGEKRYRRKQGASAQAPVEKKTNDFGGMSEEELDEWLEDNIDYSADSEYNAKQIAKKIPELKDKTKELADALDKAMDDENIEKPFTYAIQQTLNAKASTKKTTEEPAQKFFDRASAEAYINDVYDDDSKTLDYSGDLKNVNNWPNTVDDILNHQNKIRSKLYDQYRYNSNEKESQKYKGQYNDVYNDATEALKNVDEKERFKEIDDYYNNRYQSGGYASDPDGWRTAQVKHILQSFGYDVNGKKDMRNAYKDLKSKLS